MTDKPKPTLDTFCIEAGNMKNGYQIQIGGVLYTVGFSAEHAGFSLNEIMPDRITFTLHNDTDRCYRGTMTLLKTERVLIYFDRAIVAAAAGSPVLQREYDYKAGDL